MSGMLMLSGGFEHTDPHMTADRVLLDSLETSSPRVAVVPAASSARKQPTVATVAKRYWSQLGVAVDVVTVDPTGQHTDGAASVDPPPAIREADLIVLTGGNPTRLVATTATTLWPHIAERWRKGAAVSGSSAGAMVLCDWRQQVTPPRPLRVVRAFGMVRGCAAAPHFNRPVVRRWTIAASRVHPHLTILGVEECTALLGRDRQFTVYGTGAVTVVRAGKATRYEAGSRISLELDGTRSMSRLARRRAPDDDEPHDLVPAR